MSDITPEQRELLAQMYDFLTSPQAGDIGDFVQSRVGVNPDTGRAFKAKASSLGIGSLLEGLGAEFAKAYARPGSTYQTQGGRKLSGAGLLGQHGVVLGSDARDAVSQYLYEAASSGAIDISQVQNISKRYGLQTRKFVGAHPVTQANRDARAAESKVRGDALGRMSRGEKPSFSFSGAGGGGGGSVPPSGGGAAGAGDDEPEDAPGKGPYDDLMGKRKAIEKGLQDEWAGDPSKRSGIGGEEYKRELHKRLKAEGVHKEGDDPKKGSGYGMYKGFLLLGGFTSAVRSGAQLGGAMGQMAHGMMGAVTGASQAFVSVGQAILGQILLPFGKTGEFSSKLAGAIGRAFTSGVSALGAMATAGVKIGGALAGGIVGGVGAVAFGGIGAILGSVIPGVGTLTGAVAGAGIFAALGGAIMAVVSQVGGAVGQALGAIGQAFGQVGKSIADTLSNIQGVLSDLIDSGKAFANATMAIQRGQSGSFGEAAGVASLASILTGKPGGLNGIFSGFGMEGPYKSQRARAFGIGVGNNADFLSIVAGAQGAWNKMGGGFQGSIRRGEMINSVFGGNQDIANLLSMGMGRQAAQMARATQPSGSEMKQDALMGFQMNLIGRQLDQVKLKLETALMPLLQLGAGAMSKLIAGNLGNITNGLKKFGEFMFVQFPTMLRGGVIGIMDFGKAMLGSLPAIGQFAKTFASFTNIFLMALKEIAAFLVFTGAVFHVIPKSQALKMTQGIMGFHGLPLDKINAGIDSMVAKGPAGIAAINGAEQGFGKYFDGAAGTQAQRQKIWNSTGGKPIQIESTVKLQVEDNPDALYKLKGQIKNEQSRTFVRGLARAGA